MAESSPARDGGAFPLGMVSPRTLFLILMPTERCQFRCTYCYEDFSLGRMPADVRAGVKALMARRAPNLELLAIEWFGGEPLLACDIVEELQGFAHRLARAEPGLRLRGSMTTNAALLTPDLMTRLVAIGVRSFQITLDGPAEHHDKVRRLAGGGGTFGSIWRNLLAARRSSDTFEIVLRIHVDRQNLGMVRGLIDDCREAFGDDERFRLAPKAVRKLGGAQDARLPVLAGRSLDRALAEVSEYSEALGLRVDRGPFEGPRPSPGCYAAAANSFVVRSNGELAKCTVALRQSKNRVGRLHADGRVELDSEKMLHWTRGVFSGDPKALRCPAGE